MTVTAAGACEGVSLPFTTRRRWMPPPETVPFEGRTQKLPEMAKADGRRPPRHFARA